MILNHLDPIFQKGINIEFGSPLNQTNSKATQDYLTRGDWRNIEFMPVAGGSGGGYTGALTRGLAESFNQKIKIDTAVTKIERDEGIVTVYASDGRGTFSKCTFLAICIRCILLE